MGPKYGTLETLISLAALLRPETYPFRDGRTFQTVEPTNLRAKRITRGSALFRASLARREILTYIMASVCVVDAEAFLPVRRLLKGPFDRIEDLPQVEHVLRALVLHDESRFRSDFATLLPAVRSRRWIPRVY
jgi:hypothetical protein